MNVQDDLRERWFMSVINLISLSTPVTAKDSTIAAEARAGREPVLKLPRSLCANGTPGYKATDSKSSKYLPDRPCKNNAAPGHIFCDHCRRQAGGR